MSQNIRTNLLICVLAALLVGALLHEGAQPGSPGRDGRPEGLRSWDLRCLVAYLQAEGIDVQAVPADKDGRSSTNVFLTTTERPWEELNRLPKAADCLSYWRGTVYCEKIDHPAVRRHRIQVWEGCCLAAGPFVFFGDPELLQRLRVALT
jgi:hypothetical protein